MILQLSVKNQSIESSGITNDYKEAICEYVWNGFEAHATEINIDYLLNAAMGLDTLSISDNGDGIVYDTLADTFGSFLASQKNSISLKMKSKANKGKGRFSFSAFADRAKWTTIFRSSNTFKMYQIVLENDQKEVVNCTEPCDVDKKESGTKVEFENIYSLTAENMSYEILEPTLLKEFAWFLYLCKGKNLKINVNGVPIQYEKYVNTKFSEKIVTTISGYRFEITLIVWEKAIKEKFCCYFFDSKDEVKRIETTSYNRNTIEFNHSVYVKSKFFDHQEVDCEEIDSEQICLFVDENDKKIYKKLKNFISEFIEKKIDDYMSQKADDAVRQMIEDRKTFPNFSDDVYGQMQKRDLEKVTKEIYKIEPKVFYKLKPIQEKSLLGFLNLLLNSRERENVLTIVEQIVALTPEQRQDFSDMLKKTTLENVIDTIKLIQDRYKVIEVLRTIVFDLAKYANERDHIQKIVEQHFWLFGEQFNLASADVRMKSSLDKYTNILYGEKNIDVALKQDVEQERRMDIFMCNSRNIENASGAVLEENIIVELKAPKIILSKIVLRQIEDYMDFIRKQPAFNSIYRRWKFIAVCREVDEDVKSRYKAFEHNGKLGLVLEVENYEIYALTWDDIFKSFELRHAPLLKRLNYDREKLAKEMMDGIDINETRDKVNTLTKIVVEEVHNVG